MEKRNLIGLAVMLAAAAVVVVALLIGDGRAVVQVLDVVLLVVAALALVAALAADAAPLRRLTNPSILVLPAVVAGSVAALALTRGSLLGALTAALVATMFVSIIVRARGQAHRTGP